MRWRLWYGMRDEPDVHDDEPSQHESQPGDARAAKAQAEAELIAARSRWPFVRHIQMTLRELREENHFSQRIFKDGHERRAD